MSTEETLMPKIKDGKYHHEWYCGRTAFNIMLNIMNYIAEPMMQMDEGERKNETPMQYKLIIESIPGQNLKFTLDGKEYKKPEQEHSDLM